MVSRREFLRRLPLAAVSVHLAVGAALGQLTRRSARPQRIIVVGAGLAGLCAAFELTNGGHDVVVLEGQTRPGGRVHTLREMFAEGLHAEAGASRIPTSHILTIHYANLFNLPLVPFAPKDKPDVRYVSGERVRVTPGSEFQWPSAIPSSERKLTPAEVRRQYIQQLARQIVDPMSANWVPPALRQYDETTRDSYLRTQGVADSALKLMNLGSTPVANLRSFLDLLHEIAVGQALARKAGVSDERLVKIATGNDELPKAFASRLGERVRYGLQVVRIEHDERGVRTFVHGPAGTEVISGDRVVCAIPFTLLRTVEIAPPLSQGKRTAIEQLKYHSSTRIYVQSRKRFWAQNGLSGFAETDLPMEIWDATYGQKGVRGIMMSFLMGNEARKVAVLPPSEQLGFALREIEQVFPGMRANYDGGFVKVWDDDPWARGAVAYLAPGEVQSLEPHIRTAEGRIHFAGEHASSLRGWMQGALESAIRTVSEINSAS